MGRQLAIAVGAAALLGASLLPASGTGALDRDELLRCAKIESDAERLACYDALGERARLEPRPEPDPEPSVRTTPAERFGLGPQRAGEPDTLSATILRATRGPLGKVLFVLDNGHSWKQVDDRRLPASDLAEQAAVISRGAMGSYWLKPEEGPRVRVRRVR